LQYKRAVFDFRTDQPVDLDTERAQPDTILLLDGVFLLRPGVREHIDFSVFVRADFRETLARAEQRDEALLGSVDEVRRRYHDRYIPAQQRYLAEVDPERWASIVVDNNDPTNPRFVPAV
jgi:uridine kinase